MIELEPQDYYNRIIEDKIFEFNNEKFSSLDLNFKVDCTKVLTFKNCTITNLHIALLADNPFIEIRFFKCFFHEKVEIDRILKGKLFFNECVFESDNISFLYFKSVELNIIFRSCKIITLIINDSNIEGSLVINDCTIDTIHASNLTIKSLLIGGDKLFIDKVDCAGINGEIFSFGQGKCNFLELTHSEFDSFFVFGVKQDSFHLSIDIISLNANKFERFKVGNLINTENFILYNNIFGTDKTLSNIMFLGKVNFSGQDLSGIDFIGLNFYEALLTFENVNLGKANFYNINWPKNYLLYLNDFEKASNGKMNDKQLRTLNEQYRQLKVKLKEGGDKIASLNFYANEMGITYGILSQNKESGFWDWLLFWTNKKFSNFGLSYTLPLKWLILFHSIFFTLLVLLGYDGLSFVWPWNNFGGVADSLGYYFHLLNPLHKLVDTSNGWILFIDFFMRVINSYFIFYFLKATRKFTA